MAAPASASVQNLSGKWVINKKLSDDQDAMLNLQGVPFIKRKAMNMNSGSLIQEITQTTSPSGTTTLNISNIVKGKPAEGAGSKVLDGREEERPNKMFGSVKTKNEMVKVADLDDSFLKSGWDSEQVMKIDMVSLEKGWTQDGVWGFEVVGGERRYVRKVVGRKGEKVERARLVLDWVV